MDRWDQKQVLVVSDILRASLVLLLPVAILINVWLAYPHRVPDHHGLDLLPARPHLDPAAHRPRGPDLLSANSAMWVGETLADVVNYPLAGLFVVFLGSRRWRSPSGSTP